MKLVLAEKPSVSQSLAKVLGANKRCDGYIVAQLSRQKSKIFRDAVNSWTC